jgi:hypothetical protein
MQDVESSSVVAAGVALRLNIFEQLLTRAVVAKLAVIQYGVLQYFFIYELLHTVLCKKYALRARHEG